MTLISTLAPVLVLAAAYDAPRTFQAAELLTPAQVRGPHHTVASAVKSEGYFHEFDITTDYGPLQAEGRSMLATRLQEVGALAELDKVSKSEVFLKSAGNSVLNVGKGAASAVKDPGATAKGVAGGVKRFGTNLGRKAKRAADDAVDSAKKDDEQKKDAGAQPSTADKAGGVAQSALGVNASARKWAQKVGVDPYTTNPVLKKALTDLGQIDAAGSLAAKVAVPIPKVVSSTATVGNLVWSQDPEALLKGNEQKLRELGAKPEAIKKLYKSEGFSLSLHTRLATALRAVNVPGCADYVETAAEADTEREALFFVESAEMLARFHKTDPVTALLSDSRAVVAKTKDARAVVLLPVDWVAWTQPYDKALAEVTQRSKTELKATGLELRTTATFSPAAKQETAARGWKVVEKVPAS
ncbi:MAG TPA: hypothetical protein VMX54_02040 [Vicinamibacteria bacterium]|nr:hypothetical protein [Vicinamibacteria bacterium]